MNIKRTKRVTSQTLRADAVNWLALLVLLAQLPHYFHLPWWVSLFGAVVIVGKVASRSTKSIATQWLLHPVVLTSAAALTALAVRFHYGYFLGRDPCVAFLFLLVSFKFAESRNSKDATLLICLSGFLLLTQYFYAQTIVSAAISLPAVVTTGACLLALHNQHTAISISSAVKLSAKLLLQGAPIAAALFLLFPRLPGPLWSLPNDSMAKTGLSDMMAPGSISALSLSDDVAFRVEFDGLPPPAEQRYWRGPVLEAFDGRQWSIDSGGYRPANLPVNTEGSIAYTVTLEPHHRKRLFALDLPSSLPVRVTESNDYQIPLGRVSSDRQLLTNKPVQRAIRYRQLSTPGRTYTEFSPRLVANTQIAGTNTRTEQFAQTLRSQHRSDVDYANAVMQWFNQEAFFYTLQPNLLGHNPVDDFLFNTREGFCEHFASAFVVLMRSASIPARVVTGYLGGEMNGDYMIVRQSDAHAWTEVWLNNRWVRFDPTAAVAPERVIGLAAALPDSTSVPSMARMDDHWLKNFQLGWDAINHRWRSTIIEFNNESQNRFWKSLGFQKPSPWQLTALLLCLCLLWSLWMLRTRRKETVMSLADRLWIEFCSRLARAGLPRERNEGPVDYHQRCQERWPTHAAIFEHIHQNLLQLRFGNPSVDRQQDLVRDTRTALKRLPSRIQLQRS